MVTRKSFVVVRDALQHWQSDVVAHTGNVLKAKLRRKNLAVFVSGGGSNFISLDDATVDRSVHGVTAVFVTTTPDCGGAQYARDKGIPVILFPKLKDGSVLSSDEHVTALRCSGPTVHYVDEEYYGGQILAQRVVPVLASDTAEELAARVLPEEHKLYKDVVEAVCKERIIW